MTVLSKRPRHACDWCYEALPAQIYTVLLPSGIQALVGQCCARPAALSMRNSHAAKISRRGSELLTILEARS